MMLKHDGKFFNFVASLHIDAISCTVLKNKSYIFSVI